MYSLCACLALLCAGAGGDVLAENNMLKNKDLVGVLKQSLRRNNDDYAEVEQNKLLDSNKTRFTATTLITSTDVPKLGKVVTSRDTRNNTLSEVKRRAGSEGSWEFDYEIKSLVTSGVDKKSDNNGAPSKAPLRMGSIQKPATNHIKTNISRINIRNETSLPKLKPKSDSILIPKPPKVINKKRIEMYKKFIAKNKDLNIEAKTQTNRLGLAGLASILRNESKEPGGDQADHAHVLDMAPAKGGRVHRLRFKGQLCHRHVLLPEGPKYDSAGRWYVPEHRLVARHAYDATRPPSLLLPRCCNCCKKSVLGCE